MSYLGDIVTAPSTLFESVRDVYCLGDYYAYGDPIIEESYGRTYATQYYSGDHSEEYTIMEMKNNVPNGPAQLFKNGLLVMAWHMKNGVRDGLLTIYHNGKVEKQTNWRYMNVNSREIRWIMNEKEKQFLVIESNDTGLPIYRGDFDSQTWRRQGYGLEYDRKTGNVVRSGQFENDVLVIIHQIFALKGDQLEMVEFNQTVDNKKQITKRVPIYAGGCIFDPDRCRYYRHSEGQIINEQTGVATFESEWDHGTEIIEKKKPLYNAWLTNCEGEQSIRKSNRRDPSKYG